MTREEEIKKAVQEFIEERKTAIGRAKRGGWYFANIFEEGIKWADENPQSPWISAKDDLPYNHEELISTQDKATKKVIVMDKYDRAMVDFMKKTKSGLWYWSRSVNVLYWMPIPELSK